VAKSSYISMRYDDYDVHFVLDQHDKVDFYSASLLKQSLGTSSVKMISMLATSAVDRRFEPWSNQRVIELVFVAPPLSTQH
jgi:hypothetical protein